MDGRGNEILEQLQAEGFPHTAEQREVLTVKTADRLHNMRTLGALAPARRIQKARQTRDIVVPLARSLGLVEVEYELAALADRVLQPGYVTDGATRTSLRLLILSTTILPRSTRARWLEEWAAEVATLATVRARALFCIRTMAGVPRLARTIRDTPMWITGLARAAQLLGIGGAAIAFTAPGPAAVWIAGSIALLALLLLGTLLFVRSDRPFRRLVDLISAWRR